MLSRILVALRKESVDRNWLDGACSLDAGVALRKESVDRNQQRARLHCKGWVALRKESVDRNGDDIDNCPKNMKSLSARRAWIEINQYAERL